jgi:hypothetical protein
MSPRGTFRIRLRSIRWKDGRAPLRVLHPASESDSRAFKSMKRDFTYLLENIPSSKVAGYALVAWTSDGWTWPTMSSEGTRIPMHLIPSFVHDVLQGEVIDTDAQRNYILVRRSRGPSDEPA